MTAATACRKGIEYLIETQRPTAPGTRHLAPGPGFPQVFYLKYHLYRITSR